jgi:hypothetical protein
MAWGVHGGEGEGVCGCIRVGMDRRCGKEVGTCSCTSMSKMEKTKSGSCMGALVALLRKGKTTLTCGRGAV